MAEGKITSYDKGELAVKLKDMEFHEDEALVAADNCDDVYSATKFLHQECELCADRMNVKEVRNTPNEHLMNIKVDPFLFLYPCIILSIDYVSDYTNAKL